MGVPKFFRWLSERYPKINQRYGSPANPETVERYFDEPQDLEALEKPDPLSTCGLPPEIDRLYLDMNGIIHGCSHNNSDQKSGNGGGDVDGEKDGANGNAGARSYRISNDEIFRNVCYYLDRLIGDMVQPKEVVYMAIDGVAPRAKLNQQRSRRYRSGREGEIETNIYEAHAQAQQELERQDDDEDEEAALEENGYRRRQKEEDDPYTFVLDYDEGNRIDGMSSSAESLSPSSGDNYNASEIDDSSNNASSDLQEISPGRFKGKFETRVEEEDNDPGVFHSNVITPGTPFFTEFTRHLEHFVKYKLSTDPKWKNLTIIFSGSNVPGEGEHKIMQFIREQRDRPDYNPNLRHCIMGQDGDLIMLGLCTHEPNLVLLRERVIFNMTQQRLVEAKVANSLDMYIHNAHFEFLHLGVLRDYLAYEFETSNVMSESPWDLERTIDDFVFMTFLVGNDFLPHLPAIDIGDNAFDLLFGSYKLCRDTWRKKKVSDDPLKNEPYLTYAGNIVSGQRLEQYLAAVGGHEVAYYEQKKQSSDAEKKRLKKQYKRLGMGTDAIPDDSLVASKEASDRAAYRTMLQKMGDTAMDTEDETNDNQADAFRPVMSTKVKFEPVEDDIEEGLISRMGTLLQNSLGNGKGIEEDDEKKYQLASIDDQDLKGRYYYDKFQITPFDADKHVALRRAYMEGLVWNLKYYYEGCVSWNWYYPYHYGPMLSDLVNLDEILDDIHFDDKGAPLNSFQQLLGCMPPSQARHLPEPYRWLMTDPNSPIIDFYPTTFTVDMNGKRWPWEAVVLLPFVDSKRLLEATSSVDESLLSIDERERNEVGTAVVMKHDPNHDGFLSQIGKIDCFRSLDSCTAVSVPFELSDWNVEAETTPLLRPEVKNGTQYPLPGFSSLRTAPVQSLWRRKSGVNVFGGRSRYKTATLEISSLMPPLPPVHILAPKLIGTSIFVNYPHYVEALITAVSDERLTMRGKKEPRKWTREEASRWKLQRDGIIRQAEIGEGQTGTGGVALPSDQALTLSVRPLDGLMTLKDGTTVKSYAKFELEIPLISTFWSPTMPDRRLLNVPSRLEKNLYEVAEGKLKKDHSSQHLQSSKRTERTKRRKLFPAKTGSVRKSSKGSKADINGQVKLSVASFSTFQHQSSIGGLTRQFSSTTRPGPPYWSPKAILTTSHMHQNISKNGQFAALSSFPGIDREVAANYKSLIERNRSGKSLSIAGTKIANARGRVLAFSIVVGSFLFNMAGASPSHGLLPRSATKTTLLTDSFGIEAHTPRCIYTRGGHFDSNPSDDLFRAQKPTPPLEFAHGTTTLSFTFQGGIIVAVDSRASMGSFVGSKTVQKVLPISSHVLGTMAGGAADCQFWIRKVKSEALLHELSEKGRKMSVSRIARSLSNYLYDCRQLQLSIGTMISGWDAKGPQIFYVDNSGLCLQGDLFAVGSGSTFALGILDSQADRHKLSIEDAISLGIKAIRHATFRDAYSGGFINVYLITPRDGWKKVYTEDIARSTETWKNRDGSNYEKLQQADGPKAFET